MGIISSFLSSGSTISYSFKPPTRTLPEPPFLAIPQERTCHGVENWATFITMATKSTQDRDNCTISKVQWFKDVGGLGHESLIVTVNVAKPPYVAFLIIERYTPRASVAAALEGDNALQLLPKDILASMDPSAKKQAAAILRDKLKAELKLIDSRDCRDRIRVAMSLKYGKFNPDPHIPLDTITRGEVTYGVEPTPESLNALCLDEFTFDNPDTPKFVLRDLGVMALEINHYHSACSLTDHNSYWFARTLADVIAKMKSPTTKTPERAHKLAGYLANNSQFGRIVDSNPAEIDQLVVRIENAIQADEKRIAEAEESAATINKRNRERAVTQDAT